MAKVRHLAPSHTMQCKRLADPLLKKTRKQKTILHWVVSILFMTHNVVDLYEPKTDEFDRKTDSLYLKGIIADKMLVFDDPNVRIGCIRSVSNEWRQATLKLYIGSKSQTEGISGIKFTKDIQYMSIKNEDNQPFEVEPNDQIEV